MLLFNMDSIYWEDQFSSKVGGWEEDPSNGGMIPFTDYV